MKQRESIKILKHNHKVLESAIYKSCLIKKKIVEKDEKEKNIRKVLNLGHTFAHAYEATIGYNKWLNHGEAVLLGIMSAAGWDFYKKEWWHYQLFNSKKYKLIKNNMLKKPIM